MSQPTALQKNNHDKILEQVIINGDLSSLTPAQRVSHYNAVCQSLGLNPLTKPFEYIKLDNKVVLYARKDATEQLRKINGISVWKVEEKTESDCLIVTAYARTSDGREDIDEGAVYIKNKVGDTLANLRMKAVTKAKRRVTLSICGLGFLDESEIETIPNAQRVPDPEQDAVMTESESLSISHRASGLDQWSCSRSMAMLVINICKRLEESNYPEEMWRAWLPAGVTSRTQLTDEQAQDFVNEVEKRMKLNSVCAKLSVKGVSREVMQQKLSGISGGVVSLKDLTGEQVEKALKEFSHWENTYNEVVEGSVVNG